MKPTIGRIVHYTLEDDEHEKIFAKNAVQKMEKNQVLPGVVLMVKDTDVAMKVWLLGNCDEFKPYVPFSKEPKPGHWHWPVREE